MYCSRTNGTKVVFRPGWVRWHLDTPRSTDPSSELLSFASVITRNRYNPGVYLFPACVFSMFTRGLHLLGGRLRRLATPAVVSAATYFGKLTTTTGSESDQAEMKQLLTAAGIVPRL